VEHFGQAETFGLSHSPIHLIDAQAAPNVLCFPRADAQKIGHVGSIRCCDELPLESSQSFFVFANQEGVGQVEHVLTLGLG
jgi:hypothetical protein